jgi:hypothetical protein
MIADPPVSVPVTVGIWTVILVVLCDCIVGEVGGLRGVVSTVTPLTLGLEAKLHPISFIA